MGSNYLICVAYGMLDLMNILSVVVVSLLDALSLVLVPVRSKTSHKFVKRACKRVVHKPPFRNFPDILSKR